mmetsp:Transcript_12071/g.25711  ORF Transcript_12071/g.25711 Transcript_12071/m.25711 type:complete len:577 (+) Transcript_12071:210-1940(+)
MPPASTMAADNIDPFSQFGQLSLDPFSQAPPATADNQTTATPEPTTPPNAPPQKNFPMNNMSVNTGYPYQQQQQPMQVSPDSVANPAGSFAQPQQPPQQQQQAGGAYPNYQQYGQPPQMQQQQIPYQMNGGAMPNGNDMMKANLASPPISPLYTPASPNQSPPEGGPQRLHAPNPGMVPSMPTGFDAAPPAGGGVPVPTLTPGNNPVVTPSDPFTVFDAAPQQAPVPTAAPTDPFGSSAPLPAQAQPQTQQKDEADFWADMGFGVGSPGANTVDSNSQTSSPGNVTPGSDASLSSVTGSESNYDDTPVELDERGLPAGGEYYKARVTTPMLGAIFSSGKEVRSTLYKTASNSFVEAIGERPVISFTIDGSAADTAGIGLGHVLLKVNDTEVHQTDAAVKTVGSAARPMVMEFYIPNKNVKVQKTEGHCMVKYDNHSTEAPASACEWKPKYVVMGDMLGKPHILYMYRSKAEYDVAVKESQTRNRTLSVKVKQFDIRGAKIFHERGTVQYPNKPKWHYFTVVRGQGLPIKISARTFEDLQPVYEGIVTFLDWEARMKRARMEQNRERMQGMYRETYY